MNKLPSVQFNKQKKQASGWVNVTLHDKYDL